MVNKLQQFYIFSFPSDHLKRHNYKLKDVSLNLARKNNFVISIAHSQLVDTVFSLVRNKPFVQNELLMVWKKRARLRKKKMSPEIADELIKASNEIDNMLFIPEIISLTFDHVAHYKKVARQGFMVNGKKYVRLMAGAGHLRRKTVLFVVEEIQSRLLDIFENGINKTKPINMSKFGAYMGMYSSAGKKVRTPRYTVVKDLELTRIQDLVHFVNDDNTVEEKRMDIKLNVFDGMGLVSMDMAKQWCEDLGLEYDAIQFLIRAPYTKGLLVAFPFRTLAYEIGISTIIDIYGNVVDVNDVDVILTESQFKMASYYNSVLEHREQSQKNNLNWYVTRTNAQHEKTNLWTSYQYLQVLKDTTDIESLSKDTIDYFSNVSTLDADMALLYFTGDNQKNDVDFSDIDNYHMKLLALDKRVIKDSYIYSYIIKTLNKKIKESYTGKLMIEGHYSFMMADPYALAQHAFGRKVTGLLKEGEFFSQYWNNRGVDKVASGRSPLTWRSELCLLNLVETPETKKWYAHLYSGIILNVFGNDVMRFADSDFDGDLVWTSNNQQILDNAYGGIPVTYEKRPVPKDSFNYSLLPAYEVKSFGTKIGLVTNYSTTLSSMLSFYPEGSPEHNEIINRLIVCRKLQGTEIDKTKGLEAGDIPLWSKRKKDDELHNKLLLDKRPAFMRYLYGYKNKEVEKHHRIYNTYASIKYDMTIDELMMLEYPSKEQIKIIERYKNTSPVVVGSGSIMERTSRFMVERVKELKSQKRDFDYTVYMSRHKREDESIRLKLMALIREYNRIKRNLYHTDEFENKHQVFEYIKGEAFKISYDLELLTDMAILLCYRDGKNTNFVHDIFSDGILNNLLSKKKTFRFPIVNKNGSVEFCYNRYSIETFNIEQEKDVREQAQENYY